MFTVVNNGFFFLLLAIFFELPITQTEMKMKGKLINGQLELII